MNDLLNLDELLDAAVLEGVLEGGRDPLLAAREFGAARVIAAGARAAGGSWAAGAGGSRQESNSNRWSAADRAFLEAQAGRVSDAELAERLGRTETSIRVRRRRRGLPGPMVHPEYITAQGIARVLGTDVHMVCLWIERGYLAAEVTPFSGERKVFRVKRTAFTAWAVNPRNWVYFNRSVRAPERIRDEKLRRLIEKRAARWIAPDGRREEWWSIGEVAAWHGVEDSDVNRNIHLGKVAAVDWGNWWILRSEATRPGLRFHKGKGEGHFEKFGTPAGDAFIVLATAVGIPSSHIARMMGKGSHSWTQLRFQCMARRGHIPWLARAYGLPLRQGETGYWADWRDAGHRFPALARAWGKLGRREGLTNFERKLASSVLKKFVTFHYPGSELAGRFGRNGGARVEVLREARELFESYSAGEVAG